MKNTTFSLEKINVEQEEEDLARDLGSYYRVFKTLYPNRKFALRDLAEETARDPGNLSRLITRLEEAGIVETTEVERGSGRPYRYIQLSKKVVPVISQIIMAVKPILEEFDSSALELHLDMIDDGNLDEDIRKPFAKALQAKFTAMPERMLLDSKRLQNVLEAVLADPSKEGEVEKIKRTMLRIAIPKLVEDEETRTWVIETVYPIISKILEEKKPLKTLAWAVSILENIATYIPDPLITEEIRIKVRNIYLDKTIEQDSSVSEELAYAVLRLYTKETEKTRELIKHLKDTLKEGERERAEKAAFLLKSLAGYLHL